MTRILILLLIAASVGGCDFLLPGMTVFRCLTNKTPYSSDWCRSL